MSWTIFHFIPKRFQVIDNKAHRIEHVPFKRGEPRIANITSKILNWKCFQRFKVWTQFQPGKNFQVYWFYLRRAATHGKTISKFSWSSIYQVCNAISEFRIQCKTIFGNWNWSWKTHILNYIYFDTEQCSVTDEHFIVERPNRTLQILKWETGKAGRGQLTSHSDEQCWSARM